MGFFLISIFKSVVINYHNEENFHETGKFRMFRIEQRVCLDAPSTQKFFFWYILLKKKNMMNILNISFIEGIKTTGNRKKTSLLSMKEKQLQH